MSGAYYNEIDPRAAAWLRELIKQGHIAPGEVDTRSISDVTPTELAGFTQCHFFAGIGAWSYALRLAGWSDDRPVWTGSCPCQPFSDAGEGRGFADERHLWPMWHWLITQCRPRVVFGEQVASKAGLAWLDVVRADLEAAGLAFGALDLCAAGVGAPHIRQRSYWVADDDRDGCGRITEARLHGRWEGARGEEAAASGADRPRGHDAHGCGAHGGMGDADAARLQVREPTAVLPAGGGQERRAAMQPSSPPAVGPWADCEWVHCSDGKFRPVEPGTFPLSHGSPARVGRLRGYGNAIVAPLAAEFIGAYMDSELDLRRPAALRRLVAGERGLVDQPVATDALADQSPSQQELPHAGVGDPEPGSGFLASQGALHGGQDNAYDGERKGL